METATVTANLVDRIDRKLLKRIIMRNKLWKRTGYIPHPKQQAVHDAIARGARFIMVPAGTRSGKTQMVSQELLVELAYPPPTDQVALRSCQISAPVAELTDKVFRYLWHYIVNLGALGYSPRLKSERSRYIEMPWGARVDGRTTDDPTSLQGEGIVAAVCDEDAETKEGIYNQYIRRALTDARGWCVRIGVPRGRNYWYWDYLKWTEEMQAGNPDYFTTTFTSYDNPYLPPGEVAKIEAESKRQGWHDIFRQEYMAEFSALAGLVYPQFTRIKDGEPWHVGDIKPLAGQPLVLGIDWGFRNPFVCIIAQMNGDKLYVLDELYLTGRTDQECADAVLGHTRQYGEIDMGFADPSSPEAIATFVKNGISMYQPGAKMRTRINNVNDGITLIRQLLGVEAQPMLRISEKCVNLIRELEAYQFSERAIDEKPVKVDDHGPDALRYLVVGGLGKTDLVPVWL